MVNLYFGAAIFLLLVWLTSYTTLREGILAKRTFLIAYRTLQVTEIESVEPNKKNGKWGYGTVIDIHLASGEKLTFQPNHPLAFLLTLRQQAPQAEFLL